MTTTQAHASRQIAALQNGFLVLLPRIEGYAQFSFRGLRCPQSKADSVQETIAISFHWYVRLIGRGKNPAQFPTTFAAFAVRAVKSGRRLCGQEPARDVLSRQAQLKHGFRVNYLASSTSRSHERIYSTVHGQRQMDAYEEILQDNSQTAIPEQVCFRLDWPAWLATRTERDRRIIRKMTLNDRTSDLARHFGIGPSRISQLRQNYREDWTRFCGDLGSDPSEMHSDQR